MSLRSWRGRAIYFVLLDRFQNGDVSRDDFGKGEYSPTDDDFFQGGDLEGLRRRLPYIRGLGFDALWITPPVHNQWLNPPLRVRGYHGYWTYDFTAVDPHFGTLADYKALVRDAHRLGIKVIQDIVVNHTGNYFSVSPEGFDPRHPERNWKMSEGAFPPEGTPKAPNDPVFRMNNPNVPEHKQAAVYNFTPNISDYRSRRQTLAWAMGDLDDVNLDNPRAAERMKEIYRYWIEEVGVDGFRVDTVYYTPEHFYEKFLHDRDPKSPGVKRFARGLGIKDFFVFGEVWSYDYRAISRYLRGPRAARLDSAIDHPLNEALTQVFYRKAPTERLRPALAAFRRNPSLWVNFLDNHDVERMHARAAWPAVRQSLVALFCLPGIPCVYYGTEAGFTAARRNMFDPRHFDPRSRAARFLRRLIRLRKRHPVLSEGRARVEIGAPAAGPLAIAITRGAERYRLVFNTAPSRALFNLGPDTTRWKTLLSSGRVERRGRMLLLPPESYFLLRREGGAPGRRAPSCNALKSFGRDSLRGEVAARFAPPRAEFRGTLFVSCDGRAAPCASADDPRSGTIRLDSRALGNGRHRLSLIEKRPSGALRALGARDIVVANPYRTIAEAVVPPKETGGLRGGIHPPAEASYGGQLWMRRLRAQTSGRDLRLEITLADVTNAWNPPNGYDHVYFHVFFDFPGRPGKPFFPKVGCAPPDFAFGAGFLLYGWGSRSFAAADSSPNAYGSPLPGEVLQKADAGRKTVTFTFPASLFGRRQDFAGTKIHVSTWDGYLGDLREIVGEKAEWNFWTTDKTPSKLPKIYDHMLMTL